MQSVHDQTAEPPRVGWNGFRTTEVVAGLAIQSYVVVSFVDVIRVASGDPASDLRDLRVYACIPTVLALIAAAHSRRRTSHGYWPVFATWFFWLTFPFAFVLMVLAI